MISLPQDEYFLFNHIQNKYGANEVRSDRFKVECQTMGISSRTVDRLVERNLLHKQTHQDDGRNYFGLMSPKDLVVLALPDTGITTVDKVKEVEKKKEILPGIPRV